MRPSFAHNLSFLGVQTTARKPVPVLGVADTWARRVLANGGAFPADNTISAVAAFWSALQAASISSKVISCITLCPDNLIAATTPLFPSAVGSDPWTNHSFVSGDLTVNGLLGDGSSKYLDTGVNSSTVFPDDNSAGVALYNMTASDALTGLEIGYEDAAGNRLALSATYSGVAYFDCWNTGGGGGRLQATDSLFTGFTCGSRVSGSATALYHANSGGFGLLAFNNSTTAIGSRPNGNMAAMAFNANGVIAYHTSRRISFFAIHKGLSQSETQALFSAVQNMRMAFGGGYA